MILIYGFCIPTEIVEHELFESDVYRLDDKYLYGISGKETGTHYIILDESIGNLLTRPPNLDNYKEEIEVVLQSWLSVYESFVNDKLTLEELEPLSLPEQLEFNWYIIGEY